MMKFMTVAHLKKTEIQSIDLVTGDLDASWHDKVLGNIPNDPSKTMGLQSVLKIAENLRRSLQMLI